MKILAIETSCDETAAAVVKDGTKILSNVVASSSKLHEKYGGVVPEIAARKQVASMIPVLNESLQGFTKDDIDAIAITVGPGLIGSLLVGVETAKTLAFAWKKPIIPVNHVLAHMYANFVSSAAERQNSSRAKSRDYLVNPQQDSANAVRSHNLSSHPPKADSNNILFPAISLVVSGGHTELYLMESPKKLKWLGGTLDDAAGECFDKTARLLGFGNGGGIAIQEAAEKFITCHPEESRLHLNYKRLAGRREDPNRVSKSNEISLLRPASPKLQRGEQAQDRNDKVVSLPRPMIYDDSLNFSFSGLKTAVLREWNTSTSLRLHSGRTLSVKKSISGLELDSPAGEPKGLTLSNYSHSGKRRTSASRIRILESSPSAPPQNDNLQLTCAFAYEIQEAITDVLVAKTIRAAQKFNAKSILLSGGVTANLRLREKFAVRGSRFAVIAPPVQLCTDNAVCIASYAFFRGKAVTWKKVEAKPDLSVELK